MLSITFKCKPQEQSCASPQRPQMGCTREDVEVLIDFGDAGVLSGRRDSPQSRPPSEAAPSRSQCGPTLGTFRKVPPLPGATHNSRNSLKETGTASGNTCLRQVGGPRLGATVAPTALREPRAHSSPVRTFGWGRARHSSARTLTTDRAPLSLPPRTSVESDPRLNKVQSNFGRPCATGTISIGAQAPH